MKIQMSNSKTCERMVLRQRMIEAAARRFIPPSEAVLASVERGGRPNGDVKKNGEICMTNETVVPERAIKISNLPSLDPTAIEVLKILAEWCGTSNECYLEYVIIAEILEQRLKKPFNRDAVRKAVNRLIKKNLLEKKNGRLSFKQAIVI